MAITEYINDLPRWELDAFVDGDNHMTSTIPRYLANFRPTSRESMLHRPFFKLYADPHDLVAGSDVEASHAHATIDTPAPEYGFVGDPDYLFLHQNSPVGVIELKTFWKVTALSIEEVLNGKIFFLNIVFDHRGRFPECHARPFRTTSGRTNVRVHGPQCETVRHPDNS
jgi:hypothetical protein